MPTARPAHRPLLKKRGNKTREHVVKPPPIPCRPSPLRTDARKPTTVVISIRPTKIKITTSQAPRGTCRQGGQRARHDGGHPGAAADRSRAVTLRVDRRGGAHGLFVVVVHVVVRGGRRGLHHRRGGTVGDGGVHGGGDGSLCLGAERKQTRGTIVITQQGGGGGGGARISLSKNQQ